MRRIMIEIWHRRPVGRLCRFETVSAIRSRPLTKLWIRAVLRPKGRSYADAWSAELYALKKLVLIQYRLIFCASHLCHQANLLVDKKYEDNFSKDGFSYANPITTEKAIPLLIKQWKLMQQAFNKYWALVQQQNDSIKSAQSWYITY